MKLNGGCATDIGNTRKVNQDAIVFRYFEKDGQYFVIMAVCDGIGGLEQGEVASSIVSQGINQWYDSTMEWVDITMADPEVMFAHLKDAAEDWNLKICKYQEEKQICMGTTMSLLMIVRDRYFIMHVGDSRVYLYRDSQLLQLTTDASVSKLKMGKMKSYLDNYIGKSKELWFFTAGGLIQGGDLFLLCSDGLYKQLRLSDIQKIDHKKHNKKKLEEICHKLINTMMERGERDNISVGIIAIEKEQKLHHIGARLKKR